MNNNLLQLFAATAKTSCVVSQKFHNKSASKVCLFFQVLLWALCCQVTVTTHTEASANMITAYFVVGLVVGIFYIPILAFSAAQFWIYRSTPDLHSTLMGGVCLVATAMLFHNCCLCFAVSRAKITPSPQYLTCDTSKDCYWAHLFYW